MQTTNLFQQIFVNPTAPATKTTGSNRHSQTLKTNGQYLIFQWSNARNYEAI